MHELLQKRSWVLLQGYISQKTPTHAPTLPQTKDDAFMKQANHRIGSIDTSKNDENGNMYVARTLRWDASNVLPGEMMDDQTTKEERISSP